MSVTKNHICGIPREEVVELLGDLSCNSIRLAAREFADFFMSQPPEKINADQLAKAFHAAMLKGANIMAVTFKDGKMGSDE